MRRRDPGCSRHTPAPTRRPAPLTTGLITFGAALVFVLSALVLVVPGTAGAQSNGTINGNIYLCQSYTTSKGVPALELTSEQVTGGTLAVTSAGISSQSNPISSASVASGTYTMSATAPGGYFFTDCPGESVTPTFGAGDESGSQSLTVTSGGSASANFYVVPFQSATCTAVVGGVQCQLPDTLGLPFFPLTTLLAEADTVSSSISTSTPIAVTAFGGAGGAGDAAASGSAQHGGSGGSGGEAQTATTIASYEKANATTVLYYYLGFRGIGSGKDGDLVGGLGGASTIVSSANLSSVAPCINGYGSCSTTSVLALAGGGGGGGEGGISDSGGGGGSGAVTIASTSSSATGTGSTGSGTNGGGGHAGHGGGSGAGGGGGAGGDAASPKYGTPGNGGVGGVGGSIHTSSGSSKNIPWANVGYLTTICDTSTCCNTSSCTDTGSTNSGAGGEGEWRGTGLDVGGGGGGGGGYGGGGGGGGGGATDAGGGGGAGGNYAAQETATPESFTGPSNNGGTGDVYITFVTS